MTGSRSPRSGLFGRLTRQLARIARDPAALPPPRVESPAQAGALRRALEGWWQGAPARYRRLLLQERPLRARRAEREVLEQLVSAGLVERLPTHMYVPCARVFPFEGRFVATDLQSRDEQDQVFSLMFEQIYFVRHLDVRPTDRVLEVGLGSGVNALFAARRARSVTGVDINPRALAFARFNEALEPGDVALDLRLGAYLASIRPEEQFDLVLSNPPFEPVPPGTSWYLHSAGGADGLDFVRTLLTQLPRALAPQGRLELITWSPGDDSQALVVSLLRAAFPQHRIEVHRLLSEPIDLVLQRFSDRPGYAAWRRDLAARALTRLWFLFLRVTPAGAGSVVESDPEEDVRAAQEAALLFD